MRKIKIFLVIVLSFTMASQVEAQFFEKLKKAVKKGVEDGVTETVEKKMRKKAEDKTGEAIDSVLETGSKKSPKYNKKNRGLEEENGLEEGNSLEEEPGLLEEEDAGSSFKRGSRILYEDNFSQDAVGDFPAKWNSKEGGEVRKLKGFDEK